MQKLVRLCSSVSQTFSNLRVRPDFRETFLAANYSIENWLSDDQVIEEDKNRFLGMYRFPYYDEDDTGLIDAFIENNWTIQYLGNQRSGEGLAFAKIVGSISVSYSSHELWNTPFISLSDGNTIAEVKHASILEHFNSHVEFINSISKLEILKSQIPVKSKSISLQHHHGKEVLKKFSEKLIQSKFVDAILCSLSYKQHSRKFIHKVHEDGLIEIVLIDSKDKYSLLVKTTGRNLRETQEIARLIEEEFN